MANGELTAGFLLGFLGYGLLSFLLAGGTHALIAESRISQILDDKKWYFCIYYFLPWGLSVEMKRAEMQSRCYV